MLSHVSREDISKKLPGERIKVTEQVTPSINTAPGLNKAVSHSWFDAVGTNKGFAEFAATSGAYILYIIYMLYMIYILLTCYHVTMSIIYSYDDSSIMHPFFVVGEIASSALRGHDKIPF